MERYLTPSFVLIMLSSRYQHLIRHVSEQVNTTRAPQSKRTTKAEYGIVLPVLLTPSRCGVLIPKS